MTLLILVFALLQSQIWCHPVAFDDEADVTYRGVLSESGTVEHFHDIHYAQDTSGEYRFAPPRPVAAHPRGTVFNASVRGAACPQLQIDLLPFFNKPPKISENCLSVFIARPANTNITRSSRLPVLAWLHGGGIMYGSGTDPHTNPDRLIDLSVELKQPVLFVGINYRLGMFGFAASDTLQAQRSQNVGLRDQRLAFEWLQRNIAIFGGDPDRITSYGLSAGGTLTSFHHVSYGGQKGVPFNQAFMMSGPTGTSRNQSTDGVKINTAIVSDRLGCPTSGQAMVNCLREVDVDDLVRVSYDYARNHHPPYGLHTYLPVIDGDFLPDRASKLIHEGRFVKNIPTILAWTEDDGATNAGPASSVQDEQSLMQALEPWTAPVMNESQVARILELYSASEFEAQAHLYNQGKQVDADKISPHWYRVSAFLRDMLFTCSSIDYAHQLFKQTRSTGVNPGFDHVWLYQLNQSMLNPLFDSLGMGYIGTAHGSDTNYIFNGLFPEGSVSQSDAELSRTFAASIIHFAHTGNPVGPVGGETFNPWPPAFDQTTTNADEAGLMPSDVNLLVVGGPHGTRAVRVSKAEEEEEATYASEHGNPSVNRMMGFMEGLQEIMMRNMGMMNTAASSQAKARIQEQMLFKRCEYVNSLAETLGV